MDTQLENLKSLSPLSLSLCVCTFYLKETKAVLRRALFSPLFSPLSSLFFYVLLFCVFNTKRDRICEYNIKERSFFFLRDDGARVRLK